MQLLAFLLPLTQRFREPLPSSPSHRPRKRGAIDGEDGKGRWRAVFPTKAEESDEQAVGDESTYSRLQRVYPLNRRYNVVHRNLYNVHQRVAASFRKGRVFLAGDSAHVNNPLGGLGLNFGIHDAMEITGLLGKVIRKEASPEILDAYDRYRRPLNIEFVQQQTIANKKRMEEKDPATRQRDFDQLRETAEDPAAHRAYVRKASLLDSVKKRADAA